MAMSRRSIPMPRPPEGGIPCSSARRNSSSTRIASVSPRATSLACSVNRSRWMTGSTSSEYPVASSKPRTYRSHFSTTPAMERCSRTRGLVSRGKSITNVGRTRSGFTKCSHSSSTSLPWVASGGSSTPARTARARRSSSEVCGVTATPAAAESESYIEMRSHWPPRSYSVPSAHVTVVEPPTATAAFCTRSCVRSAIPW